MAEVQSSIGAHGSRPTQNFLRSFRLGLLAVHLVHAAVAYRSDEQAAKRLRNALRMGSNTDVPEGMFKDCALVGSAKDMLGKKRGAEIDAHSTVIRINRLPEKKFAEDFGMKTDVYYIRPSHAMTHEYNGILMGNGAQHRCSYRKRGPGQDFCDPKMLIMGGQADGHMYRSYVKDPSSFKWEDLYLPISRGKKLQFPEQGALPIAYQRKEILFATHSFRNLTYTEPSTGFHGVLTFATLCETLHLYGFSGEGTADNHEMWNGHPVAREHVIIDNIIAGKVKDHDLVGNTRAAKWLKLALQDFAKRGHISFPPLADNNKSFIGTCDANSKTCTDGASVDKTILDKELLERTVETTTSTTREMRAQTKDVEASGNWERVAHLKSSTKSIPKFGKCAIVAPSAKLQKGRRGKEIDSHDTVIRINRLPSPDHVQGFGSKTDVYFLRHSHAREKAYVGIKSGPGGDQVVCKYSTETTDPSCQHVSTLMLGGGVSGGDLVSYLKDPSSFKWENKLSPVLNGTLPKFSESNRLAVVYQREEIAVAAHMFESLIGREPSSSFHAFLTFAPICKSLDLYGFEDEQLPDDEKKRRDKWEGRPLKEENIIIERLRKGTVGDDDLRAGKARKTPAFKWIQEMLGSFKAGAGGQHAGPKAENVQTTTTAPTTTTTTAAPVARATAAGSSTKNATKNATKKDKTGQKAYDSDSLLKLVQPNYMNIHSQGKLEANLFKRCALVSSTAHKTHPGFGKEIDAHDTVIRTNRIPAAADKLQADLGKKTDVYFVRHAHFHSHGFTGITVGKGMQHMCVFKARAGDECNIALLVMGGDISAGDLRKYTKDPDSFTWEKKKNGHMQNKEVSYPIRDVLPVASEAKEVAMAALMLHRLRGQSPGTGLHAILTMAPLCEQMDVYGLDGSEVETKIVQQLAKRRLEYNDIQDGSVRQTKAFRWLEEHMDIFHKRVRVIEPKK